MRQAIVLDSAPLSLLTQRKGVLLADECRRWFNGHAAAGTRVIIPEIIDYELRRELLRAGKLPSLARLDSLIALSQVFYAPLSTDAMRTAARLWANVRQKGVPTADPASLDIDCILAGQAFTVASVLSINITDMVIATSNVRHLSRFLSADLWQNV